MVLTPRLHRPSVFMIAGDLSRVARNSLEQLYEALIEPQRSESTMALLLVAYAIVWTIYGTISHGSQDLHYDVGAMFAWSHQITWSGPEHPPLAAWLMRLWVLVMPVADWSFYMLGIVVATIGLWIAWRLAGRYLEPEKRVIGVVLLTFMPFYNFQALRYHETTVLTPFWAATTWWFLRSLETRRAGWAALAGLGAAASMLGKYWSLFMLAGLGFAAISDSRRREYFRSAAPWVTVTVGAIAIAPHIVFIATHGFTTFQFPFERHPVTRAAAVPWALYFLAGIAGYMAIPIALTVLVTKPRLAAIKDTLWPTNPERRTFVIAFVAPFLLAAIVAVITNTRMAPLWSIPGMTLLPVVLLSSPLVSTHRAAAIRLLASAIIFPLAMVAISPAVAVVIHFNGVPNYATHYRLIADAVERAWMTHTDAPLRIIGSYLDIVDGINEYFREQPATFFIDDPRYTPWVDQDRIMREGIAIVCPVQEVRCTTLMKGYSAQYGGQIDDVTLARKYFGTFDLPVRYQILIIPPQAK